MKSIFDKINMIKLEAQDMFLSFALKDSLKPTYQKNYQRTQAYNFQR